MKGFSETCFLFGCCLCMFAQVDPGNMGKVGASEAAQFLKRSGLSDSTLGKVRYSSSALSKLTTGSCYGDVCTVKYVYYSAVKMLSQI